MCFLRARLFLVLVFSVSTVFSSFAQEAPEVDMEALMAQFGAETPTGTETPATETEVAPTPETAVAPEAAATSEVPTTTPEAGGAAEVAPAPEAAETPAEQAQAPAAEPQAASESRQEAESVEPDKPTEKSLVPSELKGIDTLEVNDSGGNWLVKRRWWELGEVILDKAQQSVDSIMEARMPIFEKRENAENDLFVPFYRSTGLSEGQLKEIADYLIGRLEDMRKRHDQLGAEERELEKKLLAKKETLSRLKEDVDGVSKLDNAIDETINKLTEQINLARKYKKDIMDFFKEIGKVLNHDVASDYYHKMKASWQSIKKIGEYVQQTLPQHTDQLISQAREHIDRVKAQIAELSQKGIDLKQEFKKLHDQAEKDREAAEKERIRKREELRVRLEEASKEQEPGWFSFLLAPVGGWFVAIKDTFVSAWDRVFAWWKTPKVASTEKAVAPQEAQQQPPVEKKLVPLAEQPEEPPAETTTEEPAAVEEPVVAEVEGEAPETPVVEPEETAPEQTASAQEAASIIEGALLEPVPEGEAPAVEPEEPAPEQTASAQEAASIIEGALLEPEEPAPEQTASAQEAASIIEGALLEPVPEGEAPAVEPEEPAPEQTASAQEAASIIEGALSEPGPEGETPAVEPEEPAPEQTASEQEAASIIEGALAGIEE